MSGDSSEAAITAGTALGIAEAAALRESWLVALEKPGPITVNLSGLERVDSAGVQLLLALARSAAMADRALVFEGHSAALAAELEALGLVDELELPVAAPEG